MERHPKVGMKCQDSDTYVVLKKLVIPKTSTDDGWDHVLRPGDNFHVDFVNPEQMGFTVDHRAPELYSNLTLRRVKKGNKYIVDVASYKKFKEHGSAAKVPRGHRRCVGSLGCVFLLKHWKRFLGYLHSANGMCNLTLASPR